MSGYGAVSTVSWEIEIGAKWNSRLFASVRHNATVSISIKSLFHYNSCQIKGRDDSKLTYFFNVAWSLLAASRSTAMSSAVDLISTSRDGWMKPCGVRPPAFTTNQIYQLATQWQSHRYQKEAHWVGLNLLCKTLQSCTRPSSSSDAAIMSVATTSTPSVVGACSRRAFRRRWLTLLLGRALSFSCAIVTDLRIKWRDEVGFDCMEREYMELVKWIE